VCGGLERATDGSIFQLLHNFLFHLAHFDVIMVPIKGG
jgi:hypothetical protein